MTPAGANSLLSSAAKGVSVHTNSESIFSSPARNQVLPARFEKDRFPGVDLRSVRGRRMRFFFLPGKGDKKGRSANMITRLSSSEDGFSRETC